jgi:riboflavin kinase / FMN adenylyltransferase
MVWPMRLVHHYRDLADGASPRRVVSIGNFDGVHVGHAAVLAEARREADARGCELAVLTFEPHPAELLTSGRQRLRLADLSQKASLLEACGVDVALFQRFDAAFAALGPEAFAVDVLGAAMRAASVVVGEGFRFGAGRAGDFAALRAFGERLGFSVIAAKLVSADGDSVSSTRIRRAILGGDMVTARRLLGRPYEIRGEVVRGRGEGTGLGFPTANLGGVEVLLPAAGIYAARCAIDGSLHGAALYVGERPTLGHGFSVEAHLLDFAGDLYGARAAIEVLERVRGEARFDGVAALRAQMAVDVLRIRGILKAWHG